MPRHNREQTVRFSNSQVFLDRRARARGFDGPTDAVTLHTVMTVKKAVFTGYR